MILRLVVLLACVLSSCLASSCAGKPDGIVTVIQNGIIFDVYCSHGYTLLAKIDGSKSTWNYAQSIWSDSTTLNPTNLSLDQTEAKFKAYTTLPIQNLFLMTAAIGSSSIVGSLKVPFAQTYSSASTLMSQNPFAYSIGPTISYAVPTYGYIGRSGWLSLIGASASTYSGQPYCNVEGIDIRTRPGTNTYARVGFSMNNENDCQTVDSMIGFGLHKDSTASATQDIAAGGFNELAPSFTRVFGYILADATFTEYSRPTSSCAGKSDVSITVMQDGDIFDVYCSHGYTLLAKIDGSKSTWNYAQSIWSDSTTLNPTSLSLDQTEAKFKAYTTLPIQNLFLMTAAIGSSSIVGSLKVPFAQTYSSASTLMSQNPFAYSIDPTISYAVPTYGYIGRSGWLSLIGASASTYSGQPYCNVEGIDIRTRPGTNTYARVGFSMNNENDCQTVDSMIGFGLHKDSTTSATQDIAAGGFNELAPSFTRVFGYILADAQFTPFVNPAPCVGKSDVVASTTWNSKTFNVFCYNGYVLLAKILGNSNVWDYTNNIWLDTVTYNPTSLDMSRVNAKLDSYTSFPINTVILMTTDLSGNGMASVTIPLSKYYSSFASLMFAGQNVEKTSLGRTAWVSLSGQSSTAFLDKCNFEGFDSVVGSSFITTYARIGISLNNENDCGSNDAMIGFGLYTTFPFYSMPSGGYMPQKISCGGFSFGSVYYRFGYILGDIISAPTSQPTSIPTAAPTTVPTATPSANPSTIPTVIVSSNPSCKPTTRPSAVPTSLPSSPPSNVPTKSPSNRPSGIPTKMPSSQPSVVPTANPSVRPTINPSVVPTNPTSEPSTLPTSQPSIEPTSTPTQPTSVPTATPSAPTSPPSPSPSVSPSTMPTQGSCAGKSNVTLTSITFDESGIAIPFDIYCYRGYALLAKIDGTKDSWKAFPGFREDDIWVDIERELNPYSFNVDQTEAKLLAYHYLPMKNMFVMTAPIGSPNISDPMEFSSSKSFTSAAAFLGAGFSGTSERLDAYTLSSLTRNTSIGRDKWISLIGENKASWDNVPNCNREGVQYFIETYKAPVVVVRSNVRFGIIMNSNPECSYPDSAIGFGIQMKVSYFYTVDQNVFLDIPFGGYNGQSRKVHRLFGYLLTDATFELYQRTAEPTAAPTIVPTAIPSSNPSTTPTFSPSVVFSSLPSSPPTIVPSVRPSTSPSFIPSTVPTVSPSAMPTQASCSGKSNVILKAINREVTPNKVFDVYCYKGLALLAKIDGTKYTWHTDSNIWTSSEGLNSNSLSMDQTEAKLATYNYLRISTKSMYILTAPIGSSNISAPVNIPLTFSGPNAASIISGGGSRGTTTSLSPRTKAFYFQTTTATRDAWTSLIGVDKTTWSNVPNCNLQGVAYSISTYDSPYAIKAASVKAKLGIVMNSNAGCDYPDSAIGIGLQYVYPDKASYSVTAGGFNEKSQTIYRVFAYLMSDSIFDLYVPNDPTATPSSVPTPTPSSNPSKSPSCRPSVHPSIVPSIIPSAFPSTSPSSLPTPIPTPGPTAFPSVAPSVKPTRNPSESPSLKPSAVSSVVPSMNPSSEPSVKPSIMPSVPPSIQPSAQPSARSSAKPSAVSSVIPSVAPSTKPTRYPTTDPSERPSIMPSPSPSVVPSVRPSALPSKVPSVTKPPTPAPTIKTTDYIVLTDVTSTSVTYNFDVNLKGGQSYCSNGIVLTPTALVPQYMSIAFLNNNPGLQWAADFELALTVGGAVPTGQYVGGNGMTSGSVRIGTLDSSYSRYIDGCVNYEGAPYVPFLSGFNRVCVYNACGSNGVSCPNIRKFSGQVILSGLTTAANEEVPTNVSPCHA